jgi:hypothetical protein
VVITDVTRRHIAGLHRRERIVGRRLVMGIYGDVGSNGSGLKEREISPDLLDHFSVLAIKLYIYSVEGEGYRTYGLHIIFCVGKIILLPEIFLYVMILL